MRESVPESERIRIPIYESRGRLEFSGEARSQVAVITAPSDCRVEGSWLVFAHRSNWPTATPPSISAALALRLAENGTLGLDLEGRELVGLAPSPKA